MRKVLETDGEAFGMAEELYQGKDAADIPNGSEAQAGCLCRLVEELRNVRKKARASKTKVKALQKLQQEAECTRDDGQPTFRNERKAQDEQHLEETKRQEEFAKACMDATETSELPKAEMDGAFGQCFHVLSYAFSDFQSA